MGNIVISEYFDQESNERREYIACPSCRADDASSYRVSHDRLFGRRGQYKVVRCRRCDMMYTNPRPTFEALGKHYPSDYFCYASPESRKGIRGLSLDLTMRVLTRRRIGLIEKTVGRLAAGTRVCDVGCSYGELLHGLKTQRQCDATGVDISRDMTARCERRGIRAHAGTLNDAGFAAGSFDLITMTEYLEHEPDPRTVLEECRRVTRVGGHLAIEIPLISSLTARLFGSHWAELDLPRHLTFFTPETLGRMLREVGYEVVKKYELSGSFGTSVLQALGYEGYGRLTTREMVTLSAATLAFAPIQPLLSEFVYVIARATPMRSSVAVAPEPGEATPRELAL